MRGINDTEEIRELRKTLKELNTEVRRIERKIYRYEQKKLQEKKNVTLPGRRVSLF